MSSTIATPAADAPVTAAVERSAMPLTLAQRALLAAVGLGLIAIYAPTVKWLFGRWTLSVWHNAHGLIIPFVVGYFAWQELRPLSHLPARSNGWGFLFLAAGLAMHVLDTGMHTQILSAASIVVVLPGLALLFLGTERTRAIAFPLAFLVFMLPIPLVVTERIHLVLRDITTFAVSHLVPLLGISLFTEGHALNLREGTVIVGDACSGFSTLYASCAVAALTAYSCDRPRGKVLALASAVPLAIASNIVRVVLLVLAVRFMGMPVLDTWMHPASGMLTFALALPAIMWLGRPSAKSEGSAA